MKTEKELREAFEDACFAGNANAEVMFSNVLSSLSSAMEYTLDYGKNSVKTADLMQLILDLANEKVTHEEAIRRAQSMVSCMAQTFAYYKSDE